MELLKATSIQARNADPMVEEISHYVASKLGVAADFVGDIPWQQRERLIDNGEVHIGWICGLPYIWKADKLIPDVELLAAAVMDDIRYEGTPVYFSDVVVLRDSPYRTFSALRGARWAFNEPNSHSGYNVVRYYLATINEPSGYFGEVIESGAHQRSLEMLLDGRIDASAIDSTVLEIEIAKRPMLVERIRVIEILGPSPIPPWVISRKLPRQQRQAIRSVYLDMHKDKEGNDILRRNMIDRFVSVTDQAYDPIREMERIARDVTFS